LDIRVEDEVPGGLLTDPQRLQQVLNNLLSNAIKFTHEGGVTVVMGLRRGLAPFASETLNSEEGVVVFEVTDTGIGIAEEHLMSIFEAFQQADGSTSRRYGGTGLGLSISREIARILGGEIHVRSRPGEGSTFTLFLSPRHLVRPDQEPLPAVLSATTPSALGTGVTDAHVQGEVPEDRPDDRHEIEPGDRVLLIVAEEEHLLISGESAGRAAGFKILIATRGDSALALATTHGPDAIVLDTGLHGVDGLALLEELKRLPSTRHIPVHVISSAEQRTSALSAGAVAYLEKPATADDVAGAVSRLVGFIETPGRRLLVVEDDARERAAIIELVGGDDVEVVGAASSDEALEALGNRRFDCMVLDLKLPRTGGFALLEQVKSDEAYANMPVVVYTGKELTRREETRLKKYAETIIVKDARSPERLLDETALFLHRVESRMPVEKRRIIEQLHSADAVFAGRTVLIVDDDVRNVFALTSAFEGRGMRVLFGENGREGIEALEGATDGVDLVLMDIMMPEMDGYAAMRAIRQEERFRELPIIALTAKAMKGDREECIAAGASDYITKPVDIDQLLSLMRVWLYR
ncbi:MAG: multi-sensor hybrid histidine kinase, partial [Acidimicrobiaceae bacterium]|nr:multi-sensor hybrid histidine kinase [Acidimicrobiaceae bacterium]